jgi:hypothetical protein
MRILVILLLSLFAVNFAQAVSDYRTGPIINIPKTIKVLRDNGQVQEYQVKSRLDWASFNYQKIQIGAPSMCMPYLGKLAEPFLLTIKVENQLVMTVTAPASSKKAEVTVFGTCDNKMGLLCQILESKPMELISKSKIS